MRHACLGLLALATFACGDSQGSVVTPTPPAAPAPRPAPLQPARRFTGVVLDSFGAPVEGAVLVFDAADGPLNTVTDAAGKYEATVRPDGWGVRMSVDKTGYERSVYWIFSTTADEISQNARLHEPVFLAVGSALNMTIGPDDPQCTDGVSDPYLCRRVRLTSVQDADIVVRIRPDAPDVRITATVAPVTSSGSVTRSLRIAARTTIPLDLSLANYSLKSASFTIEAVAQP